MRAISLLIEPVWNRNLRWAILAAIPQRLLIEPVWNRNTGQRLTGLANYTAFNRTSLESKLPSVSIPIISMSSF